MEAFMTELTLDPAAPRERLGHLDMLRGIALFGVLLSNIEYWFRAPKAHEWLSVSAFPGLGNEWTTWLLRALIGLAIFPLQMAFAAWWLKRFHFGPVEWLWRCLTYGKRPPFKINKRRET